MSRRGGRAGPLVVGVVVVAAVLLGAVLVRGGSGAVDELQRDAESARQGIRLRLDSNEAFLGLLAGLLADDELDEADFVDRATSYVEAHPELLNITFADADLVIRQVAPIEGNEQVRGLALTLPEPERASNLARATGQPVYTRPFVVIQGPPAFEVYVPVFRDGSFAGVLAAVYALDDLLELGVSEELRAEHAVAIEEQSGNVLTSSATDRAVDAELTTAVLLDPPGYGLALRLGRYRTGPSLGGLAAVGAAAAVAAVFVVWVVRRPPGDDVDEVERQASSRDWVAPALVTGALIASLGVLLFGIRERTRADGVLEVERGADVAVESVRLRLDGNRDFLVLLADLRATGELTVDGFQEIGARYVEAHPELINFTWVDEGLVIRSAAPLDANRQIIGLPIDLPEPERAAAAARSTGEPVYSRPFEAIQGNPSFELWVPVQDEGRFLGLFVAVYSAQAVLDHVTPPEVAADHQVQLRDASGGVLATLSGTGRPNGELRVDRGLELPGNGITVRLTGFGAPFWSAGILGSTVVAVGLALGMLISMTNLRREVAHRRRAQEQLREINQDLEGLVVERTRELEEMAFLDVLTGLPNRRMFGRQLQTQLAQADRRAERFALLLVDLDHFKSINDTYGHDAGDALLLVAAARARACVRDADFLARLGGDEFAVVLSPTYDREGIDAVCRRLVDAFEAPIPFEGAALRTSPSIGVAVHPEHGLDADRLYKAADVALYAAKQAGRATWRWSDGPGGEA